MKFTREPKILTKEEALEKLRHFCGYQERSRKQVERKMNLLHIATENQEEILQVLELENFINQQRFTTQYARGKSRMKGWGMVKITRNLSFELGKDFDADLALESADLEMAKQKLRKDLIKKYQTLSTKADPDWKGKLLRFCISRGFEMEESLEEIKRMHEENY